MSELKAAIDQAVNFISLHNPKAEHFDLLEKLGPTFAKDDFQITEIVRIELGSKRRRETLKVLILTAMFLTFVFGFVSAGYYADQDGGRLIPTLVSMAAMCVTLICQLHIFLNIDHRLRRIRNIEIGKDPISGTTRCIELLKLKTDSKRVFEYIQAVTSLRALLVYDFVLCRALAEAEKNATQKEAEQEQIRLACAQLHSA